MSSDSRGNSARYRRYWFIDASGETEMVVCLRCSWRSDLRLAGECTALEWFARYRAHLVECHPTVRICDGSEQQKPFMPATHCRRGHLRLDDTAEADDCPRCRRARDAIRRGGYAMHAYRAGDRFPMAFLLRPPPAFVKII